LLSEYRKEQEASASSLLNKIEKLNKEEEWQSYR
jgi:hypothetical protein